jgi:hypothetical protein
MDGRRYWWWIRTLVRSFEIIMEMGIGSDHHHHHFLYKVKPSPPLENTKPCTLSLDTVCGVRHKSQRRNRRFVGWLNPFRFLVLLFCPRFHDLRDGLAFMQILIHMYA